MPQFPVGFTWGVATSAYQIEGGRTDGKGESIWDRFAADGRMLDTGDVACDHYHRWREDVAIMADLGVDAYRLSVAWTRVLPEGRGVVNPQGLGFYDQLVDELLANGITPYVTLYHWDLPQGLQDDGGWANRSTVDAFVRYAEVVADVLGDRVRHWITHNEPWVAAFLGHLEGVFAPGLADWRVALSAAHHILMSHGRAVPVLRAASPGSDVGIALDCRPVRPASDRRADIAAARHFDGFRNRWFFDPVFGKGYPADMVEIYRDRGRLPSHLIRDGDLDEIAQPIDFLGLNYYTSLDVSEGGEETEDTGVAPGPNPPPGFTEKGWPITPEAMTDYLIHLTEAYRPRAIVITENGVADGTGPDESGVVPDDVRVAYLDSHLRAAAAAIEQGVSLTGYFVWSLLDNLEWTDGFSQRFGIVWVDHQTMERRPKRSFDWYRHVIAHNGL